MATKPRERSESGFYHVFQRGVNHFDIFEDDIDREFYLDRLQRYAKEADVEIHSWCLMSNHVHLLLRTSLEKLSTFMMKLGSVYVRRFNKRHGRTGPLFECRFSSVCVETDSQLLAVIRYIHRNPVHHEKTTLTSTYRWSSYREYITMSSDTCKISFALGLFGGVESFVEFHETALPSELERHLDLETTSPMGDDEARFRLRAALQKIDVQVGVMHIGTLPKKTRNKAIAFAKLATGCSLRQLQRLTALSYETLRAAISQADSLSLDTKRSATSSSEDLFAPLKAVRGIGYVTAGNPLPPAH